MKQPESTLSTTTVYGNAFLSVELVEIGTPDGGRATRTIVRHGAACVALCRLPDGRFIFVRQYRKAIDDFLVEAVAGGIEPGEQPEACIEREIREETGYAVRRLDTLGRMVCCPGYCDEVLYGFYADIEPVPGERSPDDDEHIETLILDREAVESAIRSGVIWDAKTLACWLWFRQKGD